MTPGEEFASAYDEIADLTATTDMSGAMQPQFIARMLGAAPADVVHLHDIRRRLDADPDDLDTAADAERSLGVIRELRVAADGYAAREADRAASAPAGATDPTGTAGAADAASTAAADELECLAFADTVDGLLERTGVTELTGEERVDALAHALRTPRERIRAVIDAHAEVGDPDVDPSVAVTAVRAARPVLDRLVDRVEHGDVQRPPTAAQDEPGTDATPTDATPLDATPGPPELDELTRLAREQVDLTPGGGVGWLVGVLVALVLIVVVLGVVIVAAG